MNTCNGDSGYAAFHDLGGRQVVLAGMTDWGDDACADFGIDVDIGYYLDWIQARMYRAPRLVPFAPVEHSARGQLNASPDQVTDRLSKGPNAEAKFDSMYKNRWVTWDCWTLDPDMAPAISTRLRCCGR